MTTEMIRYSYIKPRSEFGKQCIFQFTTDIGVENISPDVKLMDNYIVIPRNNRYMQETAQLAVHEVQTDPKIIKNTGMLHTEGGWPREVNSNDNEATHRYRRRVERSDNWAPCLKNLIPVMEHSVLQNGAMNIYEKFFDDLIPTSIFKHYNIRNRNSYTDPEAIKRPVSGLSWSSCGSNRLAAAYSFMEFEEHSADVSPHSYIWDIDYSSSPLCALKSSSPLLSIEFNPRDPALLIGGLLSGQVCCWDIRTGDTPQQLSHPFYSHRYPVSKAIWIPSKVITEFFSASIDGTVKWWDTRYPKKPRDMMVMDLYDPSRASIVDAIGVTTLQYEPTISSRFLAGLQNGIIVNVNRRSKDEREKLAARFMAYKGPVIAIDRNPAFLKCFLTIGNGTVKVWADDTKEGCFFSVWEKAGLTGGCWSRSRCSVFFTINTKGEVKAYDILAGIQAPLTSIHPCQNGLTSIDAHENGDLIAVGNRNGNVYMLQCSEDLATISKDDRYRLNNYLERYGRYEKAVDNRLREIRLMIGTDIEEEFVRHPKRVTKTKAKRESKTKKKDLPHGREAQDPTKRKTGKKSKVVGRLSEGDHLKAEEEYFRRIEAESAKFTEIDREDIEAVQELLRERIVTPVRDEEEDEEAPAKEDARRDRKSIRKLLSRAKIRRELRTAAKKKKAEKGDDEDADSDTRSTRDRKKRSGEILKKICKVVCKPEICCKDVPEQKVKHMMDVQRYTMTTRLPEKVRSTLIEDRFFRKLTIQLDDIPEPSPVQKRRMLMLKDAAPHVLRKELDSAKAEVRLWQEKALARKLASWMVEQKLEKEVQEQEPKPIAEPSQKLVSQVSMKQVSMSKDSITRRRRRSMRSRQTMERLSQEEEMKREEMRREEMWKEAKKKAKEHDEEKEGITYPRISAAFRASEDIRRAGVGKKSQVQIDT
ncbi:dynein intermediate chain 3, ciliary-like isoform X2 [Megachile rotundata]|uniref:dynein intermediate chain 3, ciliary-like isoform X2 n=1 Tax=Megachile rotundata TaxID=143995 RepID=UPI003FD2276E